MAPKHPPRRPPVLPTNGSLDQWTNVPETVSQDATTSSDGGTAFRSPISSSQSPIDETPNDDALPDSTSSDVPQEDNLQQEVYGDELTQLHRILPVRILRGR